MFRKIKIYKKRGKSSLSTRSGYLGITQKKGKGYGDIMGTYWPTRKLAARSNRNW